MDIVRTTTEEYLEGKHLEFKAHIRGWKAGTRERRCQNLLAKSEHNLWKALLSAQWKDILLVPQSWYSCVFLNQSYRCVLPVSKCNSASIQWHAASEAGKELLYLRIIMREFGFPQLGPMHLYEDSRAVVAMSENPSNRKGSRHIDTREHFVDQLVKDRIVKLVQCRTNKMVADALTKNLSATAFEHLLLSTIGRLCWERTRRRFQR